jgi:hypothetical protein
VKLTGEVILPSSPVILPPRDDAAEYDDAGDTSHFHDDPKYVYQLKLFLLLSLQSQYNLYYILDNMSVSVPF